jgi:hypothetical protein
LAAYKSATTENQKNIKKAETTVIYEQSEVSRLPRLSNIRNLQEAFSNERVSLNWLGSN